MVENLEWYRTFYFTARAGSFSKAGEMLHITQPAVTHSIKQLETRLGGQLFHRTPKGVTLTAEGEALLAYVEQAYHLIAAGERKISDMHDLLTGTIRIGAGDTLCKHYLLPALQAFHADYPGIRIQVVNRTTPETIEMLKDGTIDVGIVNLPVEDRLLHVEEGGRLQDCFVAGPAYAHIAEQALPWERLSEYPLMMLERGSRSREFVDGFASARGCRLQPDIELGSVDLLIEFAKRGFGMACVIRQFVERQLKSGELFEIRLNEPLPSRGIGIVTLRSVPLSAAARKLVGMLPRG
ncbi:LysR family transcriptional regulator [Paenibacillus cisolokensis]|nr:MULTISPECIES: LysR family transcriptional regulator [Paenibacillus]ALS28283.1 LysR family transcriptional regulator [Paenibacillus sp. 32O-W]